MMFFFILVKKKMQGHDFAGYENGLLCFFDD